MIKIYLKRLFISLLCLLFSNLILKGQGNRLSIQATGPKYLSICGINDTANFQIFNISSGTVNNIQVKLNLPPGIYYIKNSVNGVGVSESNVSNLNQPVFSAANLSIAKNFKFRVNLSSDCNLLNYLNSNNTPAILVRADYLGNYDVGSSIPFSVNVPSAQFGTVTNLSFTGDIGTKFSRSITIGNFGKGPLKEIKLRRVNGKDIKTFFVSAGSTVVKGDTVETTFNGSFFKTIGNKDTFLDQNETINLMDSNLISGCKNLSTNFELLWGCNGKTCQVSKLSGSVFISNKSPNLKAIPLPVYPTCYSNNTFKSEIRFVNIGNMPAVSPKIGISSNYFYMYSSFDTSSVRIKVGNNGTWKRPIKDSTSSSYNLSYYGCVGLYPIGLFRVLSPDLKPNDTLFVTWNTTSCLPPKCSNASIVINSWAYNAEYLDQCKNKKTINWTWGKVYDQQYCSGSSFIPTDLINNQTGEFRTYFSSVSLLNRSSSASYIVDLIIPQGLVHSMMKKDFYFINSDLTTTWSPDSIVKKGDTLRAYFPHPVPINLTGSELVYYLKADCSKSGANGIQNLNLQIRYNPDKNCKPAEWIYLYCQTNQLKIHCYSNCGGGMKFTDFRVQRVNFGLPDNDNDGKPDTSGSIDSTKVREERCLTGDTILAQFHGVVKRTSSIISWRNAYIESTISNGKHIDIAGVQLLVWRRGVTLSVNCNQIKYWKTLSGNNATFKLDLSTDSMQACVSSGFRYSNDDSLVVKVKFKVTGNVGGTMVNLNFSNRFYTSNVNNPSSNSNKFQCDTFSGQMIMAGYFFTTCCKDIYQVNSCASINVNNYYYLGIGGASYGGNNHFPYEYRHFARLKAIRYYLPNGFKLKLANMTQYRTSGSNKTTFEIEDSLKAISNNSSPLSYDVTDVYTDSAGPIQGSDDGFHGYFIALIEPSCEIQNGKPIQLKYDFIFERKGTLSPGFDTISSGYSDEVVYNKPVFAITPVSPTIYAAKDTAEWELNFTNYSSTFSNVNTWFSPDNSGAIKIVQIRDGAKDTLIPSGNQIYKIGTIPFNSSRKFKVRAIYNSCKRDSIVLYAGWNCAGYPSDLASYPCLKERVVLYLEPQNTQLQVSLADSVTTADLCAGTPYTMQIENIGATNAYNTKAILNLPIGMSVVSGSCQIRYPHKGSKVSLSDPILKNGTQYEWNLANLNSNILAGFKGVGDTNRNKIIIYFRIKTNCDYSSGNYIRASASANIKCGDPVLVYPAISNPLNIKGVIRPYYTLLKIEADSVFPCEKPSKVKVKIINLGPSSTGKEDKYQIVLPPGLSYDSSLYQAYYNAPEDSLTKLKDINGATEVELSLKDSVQPGDSMYFELGYISDGAQINCGKTDLYSQTAVKQEVTCVADNSKCKINVSTGNNLTQAVVKKGELMFTQLSSKIQIMDSDSEEIKISFNVVNKGKDIGTGNVLKYALVYDKDASGTVNKVDEILRFDTIHGPISTNGIRMISKNVKLKAGKTCALFVSLDSSSCSCNFVSSKFPIPPLVNAGKDQSICSSDTFRPGSNPVSSFRYLWTSGGELSSDTISNPWAKIINNDSAEISKTYILTTYRGQCYSKDSITVNIYTLPQLNVVQNDTILCSGADIFVKSVYKGGNGGFNFQWLPVGNASTPYSSNTKIKTQQDVSIRLEMKDNKGCKAADSLHIQIKERPDAKFNYIPTCIGQLLNLYDSSLTKKDSISFRKWTYDAYDTLGTKNVSIDLGGNSDIHVRLIAGTDFGCKDTFEQQVYLHPYPIASILVNEVCYGDSTKFISTSKISNGQLAELKWFIGDSDSTEQSDFKFIFNQPDTFEVQLEVVSDAGCRDTAFSTAIVHERPKADFSFAENCLGDSSEFKDSSGFIHENIDDYKWVIDDSIFYTSRVKVLFKKDSVYQVALVVKNEFGCPDSINKNINIRTIPRADFMVNRVCEGDSSFITNRATITKGIIVNYLYTVSDGYSNANASFSHLFNSGDTFSIQQIVSSNYGCKDTIEKWVIVDPRIQPDFNFVSVCQKDTAHFTDLSAYSNTGIQLSKFYFGDGDSSAGNSVWHLFGAPGQYKVIHVVSSIEGCVYDTAKWIEIYAEPSAEFSDSNNCFDNIFEFINQSSVSVGVLNSFLWHFGDGDSSTSNDVEHAYLTDGKFEVRLKVITDNGCEDTSSRWVEAYPAVTVNFEAQAVCEGEEMRFKDSSLVPNSVVNKYDWDFGDMSYSTAMNPVHLYKSSGIYPVKLTIITAYNCSYDTLKNVEVYPTPTALFNTLPDKATIVNPEIQVMDLSTGADTIFYDLGNGQTSYNRQLAVLYPDSGIFYIRQIASNTFGCKDTFIKAIFINYLFVFNSPTSFTPNNDGNNDTFAPAGIGFDQYEMWVYNRWGEMIYHNNNGMGWDGTYMNSDVSQDVYCVKYKVKDYKGRYHYYSTVVTLLR